MTDDQRYFHELEVMQELGLIEGNICEIMGQHDIEKRDDELTNLINENSSNQELENHIVESEYYNDDGSVKQI